MPNFTMYVQFINLTNAVRIMLPYTHDWNKSTHKSKTCISWNYVKIKKIHTSMNLGVSNQSFQLV